MSYTNNTDIPLGLAVWLMTDDYDYIHDENYISVTELMRPLKQLVLGRRNQEKRVVDLADLIPSALGNALHTAIEQAWLTKADTALKALGYPMDIINRVLINPTDEDLKKIEDPIPIYLEQRAFKNVDGFRVGGKFDMVAEGIVQDNKSTSAYVWVYGGREDDYRLQGSLYRWLNPTKITEDFIRINYIFTDWQKSQSLQNPAYPDSRCKFVDITLTSIQDTDRWVKDKLKQIKKYINAPEEELPECTSEELWMSEPKYKYYADPTKTSGRSTKNFTDHTEALAFQQSKGKGIVITEEGEPKRCGYCPAFEICNQRKKYFP